MVEVGRTGMARAQVCGAVLFGLIGVAIAVGACAATVSATVSGARLEWAAIAAIGLGPIGLGLRQALLRLEWAPDRLTLRVGLWCRSVSLAELAEVGYRRSGRAAFLLLRDRAGRRLTVDVTGFPRDDEWKAEILRAARAAGARLDPRAEKSLTRADGTGRGYLA